MKKYEDLDESIKLELEEVIKNDPYRLKPETLYKNIYNSTGPIATLAEIFDVSVLLVGKIKNSK